MTEIITVKKLTKIFPNHKTAVDGIDFNVAQNTIFGIIGPNGSGKTTILRMLTTILPPSSGDIEVDGINFHHNGYSILPKIGYVPQKDALYPNLTVWENLDFFFSAYQYRENRHHRIEEVIREVGLWNARHMLVKNLSGGMAKRLSIACSIVHQPNILFFDEVTMGLDPVARTKIWQLARKLKETATIVMTTHYMDEAELLCDELIILRSGKIIAQGSPRTIIKQSKVKNLHEVMANIRDDNA